MFKMKTIVLSICTAFATAGCTTLGQFSDKAAEALGRPQSNHADMTAEQLYRLGKDYQAQQRYDSAIAAYVEALERDHTLADAHNALGVVYAQQGGYEYATSEFKAAIELKPGEAYLHNNLGYALLMQGSNQQALSPLEIAVQLDPANEKARFNLRLAHERLGHVNPQQRTESSADVIAAPPKPVTPSKDPAASLREASDPRLVVVAPGVYELKMPEQTQLQVASAKATMIEETPLLPPSQSTAPDALLTAEKQRNGEFGRISQAAQKLRPYKLEISNGNGTAGLARRVARLLDQKGVHTNRITNHQSFRQANTQIEYRSGYLMEASRLGDFLPGEMKAVASSSLRKDIHVRVLLGKDVSSMTALRQRTGPAIVTADARGAGKD